MSVDDQRRDALLKGIQQLEAPFLEQEQRVLAAERAECVPAARLAEIAARGGATPQEDAHISTCKHCRPILATFRGMSGTQRLRKLYRPRRWVAALAATAAILFLVTLWPWRPDEVFRGNTEITLVRPSQDAVVRPFEVFEWRAASNTVPVLVIRISNSNRVVVRSPGGLSTYTLTERDSKELVDGSQYEWLVQDTAQNPGVLSEIRRFVFRRQPSAGAGQLLDSDTRQRIVDTLGSGSLDGRHSLSEELRHLVSVRTGYASVEQVWILKWWGDVHFRLDQVEEALGLYNHALSEYARFNLEERLLHAAILNNVALAAEDLGRLDEALRAYRSILETLDSTAGSDRMRANAALNLGALLRRLGAIGEAQSWYEQALAIDRDIGEPIRIAEDLTNLANVLNDEYGRPADGLPLLEEALVLHRRHEAANGEPADTMAATLDSLGMTHRSMGSFPTALSFMQEALRVDRSLAHRAGEAITSAHVAETYADYLYDPASARRWYAAALRIMEDSDSELSDDERWRILDGLGQLEAEAGRYDSAERYFGDAVRHIESLRTSLRDDKYRRLFSTDRTLPFYHLSALAARRSDDVAAFTWFERARAAAFRESASRTPLEPVSAEQARVSLRDDELALQYLLGGPQEPVLLLVVDARIVQLIALDSRQAVEREVARLLETFAGSDHASRKAVLASLGKALIPAHVANKIKEGGISRVIIAPDGPLHSIAWDGIGLGGSDASDQRLLRWAAVSIVPSVTWWVRQRNQAASTPPPRDALVVADPRQLNMPCAMEGALRTFGVNELGPLPGARREAEVVSDYAALGTRVFSGDRASAARLAAEPHDQYRILHFATHAFSSPSLGTSGILVGCSGMGDVMDGDAIRQLRLTRALVVLSACDSSVGRPISGEGTDSLAYAFLLAGAASVVATRGPVPDDRSARFIESFYRELAANQSVDHALRRAKLASATVDDTDVMFAFQLVGFGDQQVEIRPTATRRVLLGLSVVPNAKAVVVIGLSATLVLILIACARMRARRLG